MSNSMRAAVIDRSAQAGLTFRVVLVSGLAAIFLGGCATTPPARPSFPPHLGHLAGHPFFTEQCHVKPSFLGITSVSVNFANKGSAPAPSPYGPSYSQAQRQHRCQWLHDDLQRQIAYTDKQFRDNNRCVSRVYEVNGQRQSDTRECRFVQEGYNAKQQPRSRESY